MRRCPVSPVCLTAASLALGALAGTLAGCARTGPPGGGPEDSTPPFVESTTPTAGGTFVNVESEIIVDFSEEMNRVTVERAFSVAPRLPLRNFSWRGRSLVVRPEESLPDSTTFLVAINETAQDYHGVAMGTPFSLLFSTGGTIDTGSIEGIVVSSGEPVAGAIVWACPSVPTPDGAGKIRPCGYQSVTGTDGTFSLARVRSSGNPYTIFAFIDADGDGVYSADSEVGGASDMEALIEQDGAHVAGIVVEIGGSDDAETAPESGQTSPLEE
jgi:hypothetical protein